MLYCRLEWDNSDNHLLFSRDFNISGKSWVGNYPAGRFKPEQCHLPWAMNWVAGRLRVTDPNPNDNLMVPKEFLRVWS